ncbi:unnamed protein product [Agarophyton chilense]
MSVLAPNAEQSAHIRLTVKQLETLLDHVEESHSKDVLIKEIRRNVRVIHPSDLPPKPLDQAKVARLAEATTRAQTMVAKLRAVRQAHAELLRTEIERTHQQAAQLPSVPAQPQHYEPNSHLPSLAAQVNDEINGTVDFIQHLVAASEDTKNRVHNVTKALEIANGDEKIMDSNIISNSTGTLTDIANHEIQFPIPSQPTEEMESYPDEPFVTPRSKMRKRAAAMSRRSPRTRIISKLPI